MIQPLQRNNPFRIAYDLPELLETQRASFNKFIKDGISEEFSKMTGLRLENSATSVELVINGKDFRLIAPEDTPKDCLLRVKTYSCKLYVQAQMVWRDGAGKCLYQTTPEWVLVGNLPLMTKRGHFIINGSPRIVVHQVVRSPGIYFQEISERDNTKKSRFYGDIIPRRGAWVRLQTTQKGKIEARLKKGKKVSADMLQRCLQVIEKQEYVQSQPAFGCTSTRSISPPFAKPASTLWFQAWAKRCIKVVSSQKDVTHRFNSSKLLWQTIASHTLEEGTAILSRPNQGVKKVFWKAVQIDNTAPLNTAPLNRDPWKGLQSSIKAARYRHAKSSFVSMPKGMLPFAAGSCKDKMSQIGESLPQLAYTTGFATIVSLSAPQGNGSLPQVVQVGRTSTHVSSSRREDVSYPVCKHYGWHNAPNASMLSQSNKEWQASYIRAELMAEDEAFAHTYDKLYRPAEDKEREELASKRQVKSLRAGGRNPLSSRKRDWRWAAKRLPDKGFKRERCSKNLWETFKVASRYDLSSLGREKINRKLDICVLEKQLTSLDIRATSHWLSRLARGEKSIDDIDHSQNRYVRTSGELLQTQFENGIDRLRKLAWGKLKEFANLPTAASHSTRSSSFGSLKRAIKGDQRSSRGGGFSFSIKQKGLKPGFQAASVPLTSGYQEHHEDENRVVFSNKSAKTYPSKPINLGSLERDRDLLKDVLSTKPINGALREFFGGNALSQYLDQTNPLAEITHKRRISSLGVGGVSRESAGMAIRGIHPTHYGRICPIETPEGKNAGLVNSLAFYAKVDERGSLETPCYKVIKGQVQQELGFSLFSAKRENRNGLHIAPSDLRKSWSNVLATTKVPVRVADNLLDLFTKTNAYRVDCIGISPIQMISVATSLIPFLEHNDANRALMGSNMQRQAVPLMIPERPLVGTGLEALVAAESGHLLQSRSAGFVSYASADKIVIEQLQREEVAGFHTCYSSQEDESSLQEAPYIFSERCRPAGHRPISDPLGERMSTPPGGIHPFKGRMNPRVKNSKTQGFLASQEPLLRGKQETCRLTSQPTKRRGLSAHNLVERFAAKNRPLRSHQATIYVNNTLVCQTGNAQLKSRSNQRLYLGLSPVSHYQLIPRIHSLRGFDRSNQDTCLIQKALINEGEWVQRGDVLTDCSASQGGELAVGKNALIAYLPWEGFNFEDAIVVSERLVREHVYTSLHIERYDISAQESKEGSEWFTNDLPGVSTKSVSHLDDYGLPRIGSFLKEGRVLVGKIKYSNKRPRTPYERLLGDILGEKNLSARDASLYVPRGVEARVIAHTVIESGKRGIISHSFSSEPEHILSRQLTSSRSKGSIAGVANGLMRRQPAPPEQDNPNRYVQGYRKHGLRQPYPQRLRDDKRIVSPLDAATFYRIRQKETRYDQGLISSNQPHQLTELTPQRDNIIPKMMPQTGLLAGMTHKTGIFSYQPRHKPCRETTRAARCHTLSPQKIPKVVHVFLAEKRVLQIGDKMSGRHGNKGVVSTILPAQDMPYLGDGTPIDILLNPLGVPSRMNVGQVYECLLGLAATYLNQHFKLAAFDELYGAEASQSLVYLKLYQARLQSGQNWLFQIDYPGKTRLMDGRSGECFDQWVTVGRAYMLKLIHMVNEKIHARATGPYALITQQPLRGRSKKGGQRLGEMEVWALEGFGAAYTLQELLTKKSDDVIGRKEIAAAILPQPHPVGDTTELSGRAEEKRSVLGHPEIFKVLICELKALCLDVGVYSLTNTSFQRDFVSEAEQ